MIDEPEVWILDGVSKQTANRKIAMELGFCGLLRGWLPDALLRGQRGALWPLEGQAISPDHFLFHPPPGHILATPRPDPPPPSPRDLRRSWESGRRR